MRPDFMMLKWMGQQLLHELTAIDVGAGSTDQAKTWREPFSPINPAHGGRELRNGKTHGGNNSGNINTSTALTVQRERTVFF